MWVMRFTVPQFIEIEDKIFGPLTWKQFLYVGGGVGLAVVLLLTTSFIVFLIVGLPLAVLAGALAFYPINNRPFSVFLENAFNYFLKQSDYFWRREQEVIYDGKKTEPDSANTKKVEEAAEGNNIANLARRLELEALQKDEEYYG